MKMYEDPRLLALFKPLDVSVDKFPINCISNSDNYEKFPRGTFCAVLGEISNMPGHVVVCSENGGVYFGFHPENFLVVNESFSYDQEGNPYLLED